MRVRFGVVGLACCCLLVGAACGGRVIGNDGSDLSCAADGVCEIACADDPDCNGGGGSGGVGGGLGGTGGTGGTGARGGTDAVPTFRCVPGEAEVCFGIGACQGERTCNPDGLTYGDCVCSAGGGGIGGTPACSLDILLAPNECESCIRDNCCTEYDACRDDCAVELSCIQECVGGLLTSQGVVLEEDFLRCAAGCSVNGLYPVEATVVLLDCLTWEAPACSMPCVGMEPPVSGGGAGGAGGTAGASGTGAIGGTGATGGTGDLNCAKFASPETFCDPSTGPPNAFECTAPPHPSCIDSGHASTYCCWDPCVPLDQSVHGARCTDVNPITWGCYGEVTSIQIPAGCTTDAGHPELICCPE